MAKNSSISWTNHTFNPWRGCTKVSPGCANCYAEAMDKRFGGDRWGPGKARERTSPANWREPLKWNAEAARLGIRYRVFCASLADWLDPEVSVEWLADLLLLITRTPHLDWLLLTKRPELWEQRIALACNEGIRNQLDGWMMVRDWLDGKAPANVWVGTTVEDQQRADLRIPALWGIPARVRFLSCEPLLEQIDIRYQYPAEATGSKTIYRVPYYIDWVICGGESGHKARPFDIAWARSLRDQCTAAGVPFFFKQLGDRAGHYSGFGSNRYFSSVGSKAHHGADPAEWPADLRIQQFPEVRP